jgi:molybdopterin converting factor small subunit
LTSYTDGLDDVTIEARRVGELIEAIRARFPGLAEHLSGMAVAIDGQIYNDADFEPLGPRSEIYFVPRISGGS